MHIVIVGAAGMLGRKLAVRLVNDGHLNGCAIERLTLFDVVPAEQLDGAFEIDVVSGDLSADGAAERLVRTRPECVFHLAAIVSGEAEQDFEKGYRVNLDGTWKLLEAIRKHEFCPKLIFTSSIAVYGAAPDPVPDDFQLTPLTSYGTQKAICELLISDYSRKQLVDGLALRLPTVCVRPGKPNAAASGFFSGIIREPLSGQEAVLPVDENVLHWFASPRAVIDCLIHATSLSAEDVGVHRAFSLPGLAVTVGEQIDALKRVAGQKVVDRIVHAPDPFIQKIVAGWPRRLVAKRAIELGFRADASFDDIVRTHIEDELQGCFV